MKKIGLIALAIVLSLGLVGAGFAYWTETLNIAGTADTGNFIVTFDNGPPIWYTDPGGSTWWLRGVISNDDGVNYEALWRNGVYRYPVNPDMDDDGGDPTAHQTMGVTVDRIANVASTTASGDGTRKLSVSISNAYPSYYATIFFSIRNWGTIPAKVESIRVTEVSVDGTKTSVDIPLEACVSVGLDCDDDGEDELNLHLSDDGDVLYTVIQPGSGEYGVHGYYESAVCGNLGIHVEQGAEENTDFDFVVEIVVVPFNA